MKIVSFYSNERQLIKKAIAGNRSAQKTIYERFSPKMLSVCRQYIKDIHFAEDVMVNGFVKVFKNLEAFEHRGSFEGWVRKIMVRESISYLRKSQFVVYDDALFEANAAQQLEETSIVDVEHIQQLIDALPEGYKMVFVLYAVEGYKHHEIATMLDISEGTSKSQLFKARKMLQENLRLKGLMSGQNNNKKNHG
ncbi:MAG: RNA polymerase sigma factor [Allomuricauda sp.]|nr:MAG: RNA polymerase sigma factor [Allomuricauda sp.]